MPDYGVRGLAFDDTVRAYAVDLTETVREAQRRQQSLPTATAALGRVLVAVAALGSTLKDGQSLTVQVRGDGPFGPIVADGNWKGELRGYITHPQIEIPWREDHKLAVGTGVGSQGTLYVIKDLGLKEPYRGSSPLISGEIAEDVTHYLAHSEQTPSVFAAGVLIGKDGLVQAAGGYLIQMMPGAGEEEAIQLEAKVKGMPAVTTLLQQGITPEGILQDILAEFGLRLLDKRQSWCFKCSCSRSRVESALLSLGHDELKAMQQESVVEVVCHFCNEKYQFTQAEISKLLQTQEGE